MGNNNLIGKVFEDTNGEEVKVSNIEGNIAHLNNGNRIAVERLLDSSHYNESIDPEIFSNRESNFYSFLGDKIRNIDTNSNGDDGGGSEMNKDTTPVVESHQSAQASLMGEHSQSSDSYDDIEKRKREIAENAANISKSIKNNNNKLQELAGDDEGDNGDSLIVNRNLEGVTFEGSKEPVQPTGPRETSVTTYDENNQVNGKIDNGNVGGESTSNRIVEKQDPIYEMFSQVKRSTNFSLNVKLNEKIPGKDFLKMWEESYKVSIIDYLVDEFTNKLLNDPTMIRDQLTEALTDHVYGKKPKKRTPVKKTTTAKKTAPKNPTKKDN